MTPELTALNAEITAYMAAHTAPDDWPVSLRAFDVAVNCGDVALDAAEELDREAMFDAVIVVALWVDENVANRPAEYQLTKYLASL